MPSHGRSMRVLVVDDNAINQRLVTVLLESEGHRVESASNGREAVEAVMREQYDVVLMDVQMPVMDGVQATRRIRALSPPRGQVPVIALTADALAGADERYRAAGMDAYLSKPLAPGALFDALASVMGKRDGHLTIDLAGAAVDEIILGNLRDIFPGERFAQFLGDAVDDIALRIKRLRAALDASDHTAAAHEAHDLISVAGNCGAKVLSGLAREIERACRGGDVSTAATRSPAIASAAAAAIARLNDARVKNSHLSNAPTTA